MNEQMNSMPLNETEETRDVLNTEVTNEVTAETTGTAPTDSPSEMTAIETTTPEVTNEVTVETPTNSPQVVAAIETEDHAETIELSDEEKELDSIADDELPNFASFTKEQLVETAIDAVKTKELLEATQYIKAIKPVLDHLLQEEYNAALDKY